MTEKTVETQNTAKPPRRTLSLNRTVESGQVRQSFSHGRSKAVVVEKKRRRVVTAGMEAETTPPLEAKEVKQAASGLNTEEQQSRLAALAKAKSRTKTDTVTPAPTRIGRKVERPASKTDAIAAKRKSDSKKLTPPAGQATAKAPYPARKPERDDREQKRTHMKRHERPRRAGKLTINDALNDDEERMRSLASIKRWKERAKTGQKAEPVSPTKTSRQIVIAETIAVQELAARMAVRLADVIKALMEQGTMVEINDSLDGDTAQLVAEEMGHTVRRVADADVEEGLDRPEDADEDKQPRPPVVTIMGHVDHGKTSLLDALRESRVVEGEAGGITQHIGAYQVACQDQFITFLDTPGHAAFTQMRLRGAQLTDIVVLVVAADDGVMPQTIEAIAHTQAAKVPMIVAINKMDVAGANPEKICNDLMRHNVITEQHGGDVQAVEISARKGQGLDKLLEAILLQAELLELKANPQGPAEGVILESRLDKGRGALATMLIQRGRLQKGDIFVVGRATGRVRALTSGQNDYMDDATPGMPVEFLGADEPPAAGDKFHVVENEAKAREIAEYRKRHAHETSKDTTSRISMAQMFAKQKEDRKDELAIIVKADAQGSVEAAVQLAEQLGGDVANIQIVHSAVGEITEGDVILAKASEAIIIGFHVRANAQARRLAEAEKISIHYHTIIYDMVNELKTLLENSLQPVMNETLLGKAEVLEIFQMSGKNKIAGSRVLEGIVKRGARVRIRRGDAVIGEADIASLQHFKDKVENVKSGQECGVGLEGFDDIEKGDAMDCFDITSVARSLE